MSYTYADRKRAETAILGNHSTEQSPSLDALRSGAAAPTREQMGRRVDLPDAMREKMETAFGADLSAVKLYESEAVAEAGASAMTRGADIAFAPGMLDFSSFGGQALLGHEMSHVVSQARGEVAGGGFLNDASLEARADREGAMAAAGQTVAAPTAAVSGVTAAAAAGPMQAGGKNASPQEKVKASQDKQVKTALSMIEMQKAGKQDTRGYRSKQSQLSKARQQEEKWRGKLSAQANRAIAPTNSKLLDNLDWRYQDGAMDEGEFFDDTDRALGIMGADTRSADLRGRLQHNMDYLSVNANRRMGEARFADIQTSLNSFRTKYGLI